MGLFEPDTVNFVDGWRFGKHGRVDNDTRCHLMLLIYSGSRILNTGLRLKDF